LVLTVHFIVIIQDLKEIWKNVWKLWSIKILRYGNSFIYIHQFLLQLSNDGSGIGAALTVAAEVLTTNEINNPIENEQICKIMIDNEYRIEWENCYCLD